VRKLKYKDMGRSRYNLHPRKETSVDEGGGIEGVLALDLGQIPFVGRKFFLTIANKKL